MNSGKQAARPARRSFGLPHRISLLIATALMGVASSAVATLMIAPVPAVAADGDGGTGAPNPPPPGGAGGAGQSGFNGTNGGNGQNNIFAGGGGGGGSSGIAAGGNGGDGGMSILGGSGAGGPGGTGVGGAGGPGGNDTNADAGGGGGGGGGTAGNGASGTITANSAGGAGGAGGFGSSGNLQGGGGGGGGGGGYGAIITTNVNSTFTVTGSNGGNGGAGGTVCTVVDCTGQSLLGAGNGGNGGAGGVGVQLNSPVTTFTNSGNITGGTGGGGGSGGEAPALPLSFNGNGGNGGTGGAGIAGSGITITNNASIAGGNGGTAGAAGTGAGGAGAAGSAGAGGAGVVGSSLTIINSGTIAGGLSGDGVTRANAITFTGGTNILELQAGSTITGNVVAFSTADTFRLGGMANASFDVSQIGGGAQYQNFGIFQKTGTSTWTLNGTNPAAMPWSVNAGTLIVNGSIANSTMTVNSGATLAGTGTVGATTINTGGTFAPGNSPGTMTVQGNLAFQSGAIYLVQVNPSTASSTNVTAGGSATLAGTVQAAFASGSYVSRTYTILSAAGGLNGTTFNTLTASNLPPGFTANVSYTYSDVILNLTATLGAIGSAGLSENQRNVAGALNNFFNSGGTLPPPFASIFGLTGGNLANALSQLSGEAATGAQKAGFQLTDQFLNLMLDPFVDGRSGVGGADHPALGFAPDRETLPDDIAFASKVLKAPPKAVPVYEPRWTVWGGAYGGSNRTIGDLAVVGSHDLSARTVGFAGGFDYRLTLDTVVGLAFAGGGTDWSLEGLGGGKSNAFQAGIYGATKSGPAYLAAAFAFANHWMSTDRFAFGDHLTADFNAQSYGGRLEGGYRFGTPYGGITPYAAIQAQNFHTPSYTENGLIPNGFALAFNGRDATDTRSELGARFDRVLALDSNAVLALRGRVAWAHDWVSDPTLMPLFQTLPGASFIVNGATPAQDSALVSAGGELRLANGVTLLAKFDGEFASHSSTYGGMGTFRYRW